MNLQEFEEPGADTNKFDMLNPTVVRPPAAQKVASDLGEPMVRKFSIVNFIVVKFSYKL